MTIRNDFEDSNRLYGGNRDNGGLANVNYNWHDNRNSNIAGRPLVVSKRKSALYKALFLNRLNPAACYFTKFIYFLFKDYVPFHINGVSSIC